MPPKVTIREDREKPVLTLADVKPGQMFKLRGSDLCLLYMDTYDLTARFWNQIIGVAGYCRLSEQVEAVYDIAEIILTPEKGRE